MLAIMMIQAMQGSRGNSVTRSKLEVALTFFLVHSFYYVSKHIIISRCIEKWMNQKVKATYNLTQREYLVSSSHGVASPTPTAVCMHVQRRTWLTLLLYSLLA
jgi:hypothetical protein